MPVRVYIHTCITTNLLNTHVSVVFPGWVSHAVTHDFRNTVYHTICIYSFCIIHNMFTPLCTYKYARVLFFLTILVKLLILQAIHIVEHTI